MGIYKGIYNTYILNTFTQNIKEMYQTEYKSAEYICRQCTYECMCGWMDNIALEKILPVSTTKMHKSLI